MAERNPMPDNDSRPERRGGVDSITMLGGLIALLLAAYALSDGFGGVAAFRDPRWLLATGAVLIGVVMLIGTLRPNKSKQKP